MTASEMKYQFEVGLDTVSSHTSPGYIDEEIDIFLNRAQDILVEEAFKNKKLKEIKELVVWSSLLTVASNSDIANSYFVTTPTSPRVWFYITSLAYISRTIVNEISASWVPCELVDPIDIEKYIESTINKPIFLNPKVWIEDYATTSKIIIIVDPYTTLSVGENFKIQYIKRPQRIFQSSYDWNTYWSQEGSDPGAAQNCELSLEMHSKIVDKAVEIAKVVIDPIEAQAYVPLTQHITQENELNQRR